MLSFQTKGYPTKRKKLLCKSDYSMLENVGSIAICGNLRIICSNFIDRRAENADHWPATCFVRKNLECFTSYTISPTKATQTDNVLS